MQRRRPPRLLPRRPGWALLLLALSVLLGACAGLLGIKKKNEAHPFEHRKHTVAGINCLTCHDGIKQLTENDPITLPTTATCVSCHKKPHDPRDCNGCHGEESIRNGAAAARKHLKFAHKRHLPSVKGQCVPCHNEAGSVDPTSLRPAMARCFGCHEHKDQWAKNDCAGCHRDLPSESARPTSHLVHDGDWLREHGIRAAAAKELCSSCHQESMCASCHGKTTAALPWKLAVGDIKLDRLHAGNFLARHAMEARVGGGLCTTCHSETTCAACHSEKKVGAGTGAKNPHPPGWVKAVGGGHGTAARLDPVSCAACHGGAGEMLCVGCHKVGGPGGNPHGPSFSSKLDKKKDVPCRLCHAP